MKPLHRRIFIYLFFVLGSTILFAQKPAKQSAKAAIIQQAVDSQTYIFHAQQALPLGGGTRQLTSEYDLRVTPDSVIAYLPYFGRAYEVPYNQTDGGLKVNTNKFSYEKTLHKKGGWDILIKPSERMDVQQLVLYISQNGYASLRVLSINRQAISFNGYVSKN